MSIYTLIAAHTEAERKHSAAIEANDLAISEFGLNSPQDRAASKLKDQEQDALFDLIEAIFSYRCTNHAEERDRLRYILLTDGFIDSIADFTTQFLNSITEGDGDGDPRT